MDQACVSYLRYNDTWGDWHGGNNGNLFSFETTVIGSYGVTRNNPNNWDHGLLGGISFIGNDGTIYGPYGGTEGEVWESNIPSSVSYISGRSGGLLDALTFHHCSKNQGTYSRVHISSDTAFLKIMKKPSIVQE